MEIVPALIEVMMSDKKASVRVEAAQSLGKIRPAMREVVGPLEQARDHDASMRVLEKLGLANNSEMTVYAIRQGLVGN